MSFRCAFLIASLAALSLPAGASAAARQLDVEGLQPSFPVITGDSIVYNATSSSERPQIRVFGGGRDRLLRDVPAAPPDDNETVNWTRSLWFDASTGVLATTQSDRYSIKGAEERSEVKYDLGPLEGPWTPFSECGYFEVELDANRAALTRCTGSATRIEIRDVVAGTTLRVIENARLKDLKGDLVAYSQDGAIVVRNYITDSELYRFAVEPSFAVLQADGKVAVATGNSGSGTSCYTLAWYSQEQPTRHTVSEECVTGSAVRFANDRFVYPVVENGTERLVTTGLAPALATTIAGPTLGFDFDGTRVVYGCGIGSGPALLSEDLAAPIAAKACSILAPPSDDDDPDADVRGCHPDDPSARIGQSRRCPVAITGRSAKVDASGRVTLRVKCEIGCRGTLRIRRRVGGRTRWISKAVKLNVGDEGARRYRVDVGGRPPAGAGWKVEIVSTSQNRVRGSKAYTRAFRLVR